MKYDDTNPAVTLDYTTWDNKTYSIDLVPAIEFEGLPDTSKETVRKSWVPKECVNSICEKFHVVAKNHSSGEYGRLSIELMFNF